MRSILRDIRGSGSTPPFKYTTLLDLVSNGGEADIFTPGAYVLPANTLGAKGIMRVRLVGDYLNNTGAAQNPTLRVYFGGAKVWDSGATPNILTSATRRPFRMDFEIWNLGVTNSQMLSGYGLIGAAVALAAGIGGRDDFSALASGGVYEEIGVANPLAVDTTLNQNMEVTCQLGSNSPNHELRVRGCMVDFTVEK